MMMGHAFQCLTADRQVADMLREARRRLRQGGRLMFESRNPLARAWTAWTPSNRRTVDVVGHGPVEVSHCLRAADGDLVTFDTSYRFHLSKRSLRSETTLRFLARDTIAQALAQAGFDQIRWFGDWTGDAFTSASREIIVIAGF